MKRVHRQLHVGMWLLVLAGVTALLVRYWAGPPATPLGNDDAPDAIFSEAS